MNTNMPLSSRLPSLVLALLACLLLMTPAHAQTEVSGAIQGRIEDEQGQGIPEVAIRLINRTNQVELRAKTDSEGNFIKQQLDPGIYDIEVEKTGYQPVKKPLKAYVAETTTTIPPIQLKREIAAAPSPSPETTTPAPTTPPETKTAAGPQPVTGTSTSGTAGGGGTTAGPGVPEVEGGGLKAEIVTVPDGRRSGRYTKEEVSTLPLGATTLVRTFDELALLLPGVATPPQPQGEVAGPGVGAGVGSAGQFSVNGLRSRGNNFTVDGSDNNDEDIGVRRQGFLSLVPQPIESIEEYRVTTLLAPAQFGRNFGAQVNAVSKSGGSAHHGSVYGFFNSDRLNSRNFFDTTNGDAVSTVRINNQDAVIRTVNADCMGLGTPGCVVLGQRPLTVRNGSGGEDSFTLGQFGGVIGGPIVPGRLFYFVSAEGQVLNATKEANFVVPTIAERGIFATGVSGLFFDPVTGEAISAPSQGAAGAAVFSLFPFPNNPTGIFGGNTFTQTLPASGDGRVFSAKTNGNFTVGGKQQKLIARYNFTDDKRTIPVTGGAIFSSLRPRVRTQNFSTFLNSDFTSTITNELKASYGRTRLIFDEVRDQEFLIPSEALPNEPFFLNTRYLANFTLPNAPGIPNTGPVVFVERPFDPIINGVFSRRSAEGVLGPVGQVKVSGFSPLGVDVFNFPQRRVNNTYQLADTVNISTRSHRLAFGTDIRRVELNSDLPRNSRPLFVYGGLLENFLGSIGPNLRPIDYVSAGAPTGLFYSLSTGGSDIGLRYYQYYFFGQDEWRVKPNLSITYGLRYEYNTVPEERNSRIESTFNDPLIAQFLPGLRSFLGDRSRIYDPEKTNFAPRVGIAYSRNIFGERATVVRAGYGIFYDQIIGSVVSQSRNVFPNFININFAGGLAQGSRAGDFVIFNPARGGVIFGDGTFIPFRQPGTTNQANPAFGSRGNFGTIGNIVNNIQTFFSYVDFGVTLPTQRLKTPMAHHYSLTVEQELSDSFTVSAAYVGTLGRHLLRVTTPNAGENLILLPLDIDVQSGVPSIFGIVLDPSFPSSPVFARSNPGVGPVTQIETSANSRYDALQFQVRGRYPTSLQFQAAYTLGRAEDDVSDVFDLAGAFALPQDSSDLSAERGPANFDVRHRFSYNLSYTLPDFRDHGGAFRAVFGGLEIASTGQVQSGQPFTVNSIFDVNGDGNLTDRLNSTSGIQRTGVRSRPYQLTGAAAADPFSLLAPVFTNGGVGRNTFRAGHLALVNLAVIKNFRVSENQAITFRTEIFNLTNRANFGIPVRFLESPGFGQATDTVTPGRRVQFALKYSF